MSSLSLRSTAFILSLIGGLIIVIGSIIEILLLTFGSYSGAYYGMGPGMMSGYWFYSYGSGWMIACSIIALASGIIVLISSFLLRTRSSKNISLGIVIIVFSIASFIGMGGYFIGAILGIAGGAIALSYRTSNSTK